MTNSKTSGANTISFEGEVWRVIGRGTNENGKTYCHLASTTRFIQQKNGKRPVMMADWIPNEVLA